MLANQVSITAELACRPECGFGAVVATASQPAERAAANPLNHLCPLLGRVEWEFWFTSLPPLSVSWRIHLCAAHSSPHSLPLAGWSGSFGSPARMPAGPPATRCVHSCRPVVLNMQAHPAEQPLLLSQPLTAAAVEPATCICTRYSRSLKSVAVPQRSTELMTRQRPYSAADCWTTAPHDPSVCCTMLPSPRRLSRPRGSRLKR